MEGIDDDFGTLYVDVIETQPTPSLNSTPNLSGSISNSVQTQQTEQHEATISTQNPNSEPNSKLVVVENENGSDSEDDGCLNIVLNDEDYRNGFGVSGAVTREGNGVVGDEDMEIVGGSGNNNGSHYKFRRSWEPVRLDYSKTKLFLETLSSSIPGRGDWEDSGENNHKGQSHKAPGHSPKYIPQNKFNFSLPWFRNILDVDIDAFREKPWRNPSMDITDYFNFGLDEESWRQYCSSLEELRQKSRIPASDFSRLDLVNERMADHEGLVLEDMGGKISQAEQVRNSLCSMRLSDKRAHIFRPKGRPIEVEDSSGERQPSMVIRRQCSYDSDVVIQIALQDSMENSTCASEKQLGCVLNSDKGSENGDVHAGDSGNSSRTRTISEVGSSVDILQGDAGRLVGSFELKRYSEQTNASDLSDPSSIESQKISSSNGGCNQGIKVEYQDTCGVKMVELVVKPDPGIEKTSFAEESDPFGIEEQLSLEDDSQYGLLSSCSESEGGTSENCLTVDLAKVHTDLRRPSFSSHEQLHDSVTPEYKYRDIDVRMKLTNEKDYSSSRSYNHKKHQRRRIRSGASPVSNLGDSYSCDTSVPYSRWNGERLNFVNCGNKYTSYETEMVCHGEATDDPSHAELFPSREGNQSLRYGINQCFRKNLDGKDNDRACRSFGENKRERDRDTCGKRKFSAERISHFYGESRKLLSVNRREIEVKMKKRALLLTNRASKNGHFRDHNQEDRYMTNNCRSPQYSAERERDLIAENYIKKFPYRRETVDFGKENVYRRNFPSIAHESWSSDCEDDYMGSSDLGSLWLPGESCATESKRDHRRSPRCEYYESRLSRENLRRKSHPDNDFGREDMMSDAYYDVDYLEDGMGFSDGYQVNLEKRGYGGDSMLFHWPEEEFLLRHHDEDPLPEEVLLFSRNPRHRSQVLLDKHACGRMFDDDIEAEDNGSRKIIEENSISIDKGFHVSHRIKHFERVLRSRASSNLCTRGGKPYRRYYRGRTLQFNTNAKMEDLAVRMEPDFRLYAASHNGKKGEPDLQHSRRNQDNRKWFSKLPMNEKCQDSDIEEGQIITEEPADNHLAKTQVSETAGVTCSERKEKHVYKRAKKNDVAEEIDDQRILETMAKMEKRRERFKEIITAKKEVEQKSNSHVDLPMETDKIKLERPIRKRQWVGS